MCLQATRLEADLDKERKAGKALEKTRQALDRQLKDMQARVEEIEESVSRESKKVAAKLEAEVDRMR